MVLAENHHRLPFIRPDYYPGMPKYRKLMKAYISSYGFPLGMRKTLEDIGSFTRSVDSHYTDAVLSREPVLLIFTHNFLLEGLAAIAGLPPNSVDTFREAKLVSIPKAETHWLAPHIFPVHNVYARKDDRSIFQLLHSHPLENISLDESKELNRQSLASAAACIGDNGIVGIAPEGVGHKDSPWKTGVASILQNARANLAEKDGFVVFCDVKGISPVNYLVDRMTKKMPFLTPYENIKVRLSAPVSFSEITKSHREDRGVLTNRLQGMYNNWIHNKI